MVRDNVEALREFGQIICEGWWGRTDGGYGGGIRDEESVRSVC